jgi:hypothetical protein
MLFAYAALIGWCGTKWPGWWWGPKGPYGPKKPQPDPWRIFGGIIGALGGVGAVIVLRPVIADAGLLATGVTAFFGGTFLGDVVGAVTGLDNRAEIEVR